MSDTEKLEKLVDDFREWKKIFGSVSLGFSEPRDRAKERKSFEKDIADLRKKIAKGNCTL